MMFSVIIVNYNTKNLLKNCLNSIFEKINNNDFEIIIVDNNSQDGSIEMLKNNFISKIKLIENKENFGFGTANNIGANIAKGDYLFFLNSDIVVKKNILKNIEKVLKNKNIGAISPRLVLQNMENQEHAYGDFPLLLNLFFGKLKRKAKDEKNIIYTDWISGAALVIRRNIFKSIGGFDENFFMYFEDIDLCKRVKKEGYIIAVCKDILIVHLGGKSISNSLERKKYYYRSQDYFYKKYYGFLGMIVMRVIRCPYKLIILFINKFFAR